VSSTAVRALTPMHTSPLSIGYYGEALTYLASAGEFLRGLPHQRPYWGSRVPPGNVTACPISISACIHDRLLTLSWSGSLELSVAAQAAADVHPEADT